MSSRSNYTRSNYTSRINRVVNHLAAHPGDRFSIAQLAKLANFSDFHFHRLFKAYTGETPAELARRLRLEQAAEDLIYNRSANITDLALSLGFSSSANFTKAFSTFYGVAPSRYAAMHSRNSSSPPTRIQDSKAGKAILSPNRETSAHALTGRLKQTLPKTEVEVDLTITIEEQPLMHLAYLRHVGPYQPEIISGLFERLLQWADAHLASTQMQTLGITWSDSSVAEPQTWRYDAAIVVDPTTQAQDGVDIQTLDPGKVAVLELCLNPPDYSPIAIAWDYLLGDWLPDSGWQPAHHPSFERYQQSESTGRPTGTTTMSLCLPVEPNRPNL